ncbi:MAG: Uma2 family endonuclease [Candidatus Promineifilaceae bacterium]
MNLLYKPVRQWPEQGQWTYDDWRSLPDDGTRYEVIDGTLFMAPPPSVAHQKASNSLAYLLTDYVYKHNLGHILTAPVGVQLPNQEVPLQPDIVFVAQRNEEIIGSQYIEGVPDLVIEILSPSNWPYDRNQKFLTYQQAGVPEYWIVDYRAKTVERFSLDEGEYLLWEGIRHIGENVTSQVLMGLEVAVSDIFRKL